MAGQRFVNPYTAYSPIGQGIQNSAIALFGTNRTPMEQALLDEKAALAQSSAQLHAAQTEKALAEAAASQFGLKQAQNAPRQLFKAETGLPDQRADMLGSYLDTGQWAPGLEMTPDWATPDIVTRGQRARKATAITGMGDKSNADQIANALKTVRLMDEADQTLANPGRAAQVASAFFPLTGRAPFTGQATGSTNVLSGDQAINPIGTSDIAKNVAAATASQSQAHLADKRAAQVDPLAKSLIEQRQKAGSGGFKISFDEQGNPIVEMGGAGGTALTKGNTDKTQASVIEASATKDMVAHARILARDERNFGASGILRSTVQDAIQQGQALALQLGGEAQNIQQDILSMGSDVNVREFDTDLPQLDMLVNILAFRMAKMNDPGGRVTDQDFKIAKQQIGGTGLLANQKEFMSRLDLFDLMLDRQIERGNKLLNPQQPGQPGQQPAPGAPGKNPAQPGAAKSTTRPAADTVVPAPVVKAAPAAPIDPASFIPTPTKPMTPEFPPIDERVVGAVYDTPQGPLMWTGQDWEEVD